MLERLSDERRGRMNYMPEIAKLLGVEIEEEFNIEGGSKDAKYKFSKDYLVMEITDVGWTRASFYLADLLNGKLKIVKLPILNDEEKKYLSYVIKPFREDVLKIAKFESNNLENKEVIAIKTQDGNTTFPPFEKRRYLRGMKLNQEYTLEELDL